jgi:SAM-dependent methyltransferase
VKPSNESEPDRERIVSDRRHAMETPPTIRCHCNGSCLERAFSYERPPAGETRFSLDGQSYRRHFERCRLCGHWFGRIDFALERLYSKDYVNSAYGGSEGLRRRFDEVMALPPERSDNRHRVERVRSFARGIGLDECSGLRLLDVGAGLGVFPAAMKAAGWEVTALEADPRAVDHLRSVAGIRALHLDLREAVRGTMAAFDVITLNKVLEHVADPIGLLAAARPFLQRRGFVYLEVPDARAAELGPGREEFFIEHCHIFSPASLAKVVNDAGYDLLRLERLTEPSGKLSLIAMMSSISG